MNKRWDIWGVGTVSVDDLVILDHFPSMDEKQPARSIQRSGGGQTATALVAAARQDARSAFCARLGEDDLSRYTLQALAAEGVDCSTVLLAPGCRPVHAVVLVEPSTGSRTIIYTKEGVEEPTEQEIDQAWIASSRMVLFDQNAPNAGLRAARLAKVNHVPVLADLEDASMPTLDAVLPLIDHLIVEVEFARRASGETAVENMVWALSGPRRAACVVTWGEKGCWFAERDGEVHQQPAYPVRVVDTTGCGDVFHGAYAAAITRGESVRRAVKIASASAALKATLPGGRQGIPDLETVERFLTAQSGPEEV